MVNRPLSLCMFYEYGIVEFYVRLHGKTTAKHLPDLQSYIESADLVLSGAVLRDAIGRTVGYRAQNNRLIHMIVSNPMEMEKGPAYHILCHSVERHTAPVL